MFTCLIRSNLKIKTAHVNKYQLYFVLNVNKLTKSSISSTSIQLADSLKNKNVKLKFDTGLVVVHFRCYHFC
jgi:hypothetical protein